MSETRLQFRVDPVLDSRPVPPERPRVQHFYSNPEATAALAMGINNIKSACGRAWVYVLTDGKGGVVPAARLPLPICRACLRVHRC